MCIEWLLNSNLSVESVKSRLYKCKLWLDDRVILVTIVLLHNLTKNICLTCLVNEPPKLTIN